MRYILDNEGYVKVCSRTEIVCESKTCTAYEGDVPEGYETIEEWVLNANINAYKVVDGQLVYDATKDNELQEQYEKESWSILLEKEIFSGILSSGSSLNYDFTPYKKLMFVYAIYDATATNNGGTSNVAWLYLDNTPRAGVHNTIVNVPYIADQAHPFFAEFIVSADKKKLTFNAWYGGAVQGTGDYYYVSRIFGYK